MRSPELDGVRGIAILLVIIFHYFTNPILTQPGTALSYIQHAGFLGWTGVDLFFVLSGYLIGGILMDNRAATNFYTVFYVRRCCRILPVYFLMVGMFGLCLIWRPTGIEVLYRGGTEFWNYVLLIQNYFVNQMGGYGPVMLSVTWSLAIEEQFYLFIPILIRIVPPKKLLIIIILIFIIAPIARHFSSNMGSITYAPCRGDSLMMGVLIAWLQRFKPETYVALTNLSLALFSVLALFMLYLASGWPNNGGVTEHVIFSLFYGSLLLAVLQHQGTYLTNPFRHAVLRWFGRRSYAIYLFHMPLIFVLARLTGRTPGIDSFSDFIFPVFVFGLCCGAAELSFRYIEKPLITKGRRVNYQTLSAPSSA